MARSLGKMNHALASLRLVARMLEMAPIYRGGSPLRIFREARRGRYTVKSADGREWVGLPKNADALAISNWHEAVRGDDD